MSTDNNMIRVNISLPPDMHKEHSSNASDLYVSFSAYVRLCLQHYADQKKLEEKSKLNSLPFEGSILPFRDNG